MSNRFFLRYSVVGIALICFGLFMAIRKQPSPRSGMMKSGHHKNSFKHSQHNLQLGRAKGRHMQGVDVDYAKNKAFKEEPEEMSYDVSSEFYESSYSLSISSSFYGNNSKSSTSYSSSSDSFVDKEDAIALQKMKAEFRAKRKKKLERKRAQKAAKVGPPKEVPAAAKLRLKNGNVIDEDGNVLRKAGKKDKAILFQQKQSNDKKNRKKVIIRKERSMDDNVVSPEKNETDVGFGVQSPATSETVERRQGDRQARMRQYCGPGETRSSDDISDYTKGHILVIPEFKLLYCFVPKAGCSNWKRVMMVLTGQKETVYGLTSDEVHRRARFQYFHNLSLAKQQEALETYYKFAFVREPLERLLSVYRNKFGDKNQYKRGTFHAFGKAIMSHFRKNATKYQAMSGAGVTWSEFTKFLLSAGVRRQIEDKSTDFYRQDHWDAQTRICSPCDVRYDFVGHMETLDEDVMYLLRLWNVAGKAKYLPQTTSRATYSSDQTILRRNYDLLKDEQTAGLYTMFKDDYEAFDYEKPPFIVGGNNSTGG